MAQETVAADNMVVAMNYTLTDPSGKLLDSSEGEPLKYLQGHDNIIPGLERELAGLKAGDKKKVVVPASDAYGLHNPELLFSLPRAQFGGGETPNAGMVVQLQSEEGVMMATIVEVNDEQILLDANHPLAGQELHFEVEIIEVRAATEEELSHGHPHGPGGHHH